MSSPGGDGQSLTVVPEKVREVGSYVYGLADTLRQALDSATREVDACVGSSWTGDAADKVGAGWSDTRTGGIAIIAALTEMAEKLGVTADTYVRQDETNSTLLNTSSLDLPGV
ncbi:type VII secretion target [Nocardia mangyaensis]|uniref:type VII secretion target n=1 Tax=Nocardia mangyaensis TaxID=2213200 RepID=UPI0026749DF9|nr:type VII secretion target [Nocardia mangyaensis]MDO3648800.1 type VII secretion target [Nocardia mangyaensis]